MRKSGLILTGIILLGLSLRFFILSQRGSLWFDEAFSVHFAAMDLNRMLAYLKFENNPPLYFILLHFWMKIVGNSELAVRSLSMIFGSAAIPLVYALGTRLHSRTAGLLASFLLAISTFQLYYSTETRMYTMYLFWALTTMWLFVRQYGVAQAFRPETMASAKGGSAFGGKALSYIPLWAALSLLIWTHITAWLIIAALAIYLLIQSLAFEKLSFKQFIVHNSKFIILGVILVLQFLPWIINFVKLKIVAPLSQGYFFYLPPDKNFFLSILENFLVFGQDNAFIVTLLSVVIIGLLWFAIRDIRRLDLRRDGDPISSRVFLLCWLFVPLLVGLAFSNAIPRYFIATSPALYLLLGIGLARYRETEPPTRRKLSLLFPMLMFALIVPDYSSLREVGHHEWDKLAQWVEHQSAVNCELSTVNCLVLVNPHSEILPFERYYTGTLPVVGFYPREDTDDRDLRIVKTNWVSLNTQKNIGRLADLTQGYNTVFLITGEIDMTVGRALVPNWFWEQGWQKIDGQTWDKLSVVLIKQIRI